MPGYTASLQGRARAICPFGADTPRARRYLPFRGRYAPRAPLSPLSGRYAAPPFYSNTQSWLSSPPQKSFNRHPMTPSTVTSIPPQIPQKTVLPPRFPYRHTPKTPRITQSNLPFAPPPRHHTFPYSLRVAPTGTPIKIQPRGGSGVLRQGGRPPCLNSRSGGDFPHPQRNNSSYLL